MSYYLPHEVVVDILQRLPVKTLIRFRCVCRSWSSLIKSPAFIHSHFNQSIENNDSNNLSDPSLIIRYCVPNSPVERYKLFHDNEVFKECTELAFPIECRRRRHFRLIGSENGLICFVEEDRFIIWNPSIRKVVNLPKPCIAVKTYDGTVFNQAFGFDPRTNDYKVVRIANSHVSKPTLVEVYSVSTGSWRIISDSFPRLCTSQNWFEPKACLNGSIHFRALGRMNRTTRIVPRIVLAFDLRDEVFREMILPDNMVGFNNDIVTCVFRRLLALLCYDRATWKRCSIWVMKEYGVVDSWVKQFTIDIAGGVENVLGFRNNGHIILETKIMGNGQLSSYDPESQRAIKLGIHGRMKYFCVDTYKENLVLLNQANDAVSSSRVNKKRKNSELSCELEREMKRKCEEVQIKLFRQKQLSKEKFDRGLKDAKRKYEVVKRKLFRQKQLLKEKLDRELEDVKRKYEEVQRKISRQKHLKEKVESLAREFPMEMDSPQRQLKDTMESEVRELEEAMKQELQELMEKTTFDIVPAS